MDRGTLLRYYKQKSVQDALVRAAQDKEIAVRFGDKGYGKRPDTLVYPRDVFEFVQQGATSFHCSEELWENPLRLHVEMKKGDMENLRKGWDLLLDIDCAFLEYSGIAADLLVQALRYHGIESVSVKFSGNHGFHIAVPFEAFPESVGGTLTRLQFPDGPRKIAGYLKEMIRQHLAERILEHDDLRSIQEKSGKNMDELGGHQFDPFSILDIDTLLISSRHLYRMVYSINEKSGLVSIPIKPERILQFDKRDAHPNAVEVSSRIYLNREGIRIGEGNKLIVQAFDFQGPQHVVQIDEKKLMPQREFVTPDIPLAEELFPPCIQYVLKGLSDGRKRSLFTLVNFLSNVGWDHDKILARLREWNKQNAQPLGETLLIGQVRYHKQQKKRVLPANCNNKQYYSDMGICHPDNLCRKIKNPVSYVLRKAGDNFQRKTTKKEQKPDVK